MSREGQSLEEETKEIDPARHTTFELQLAMVNVSLVETGRELLTLYLEGICACIDKTPDEVKLSVQLSNVQIDNQSETFPLYPVILKPVHFVPTAQGAPLFFILNFVMRLDVPNVLYIELLEFLMRGVDIKLELSHVVQLTEFMSRVGKIFDRNLIKQHSIFQRSKRIQ